MARQGRQVVRVFGLQDRRSEGRARRWIVRWEVDGRRASRCSGATASGRRRAWATWLDRTEHPVRGRCRRRRVEAGVPASFSRP